MKVRMLLALLCISALVLPAFAQGIDGKWEATVQGRGGEQKITFDLKNAGGTVTGTVTQGQGQAQQIKNGKLDGSKLTFETSQAPRGGGDPITVSWTGTLAGDSLKLTRGGGGGGGGRGPQEIEAKRVK
jgi:hypothetical protein